MAPPPTFDVAVAPIILIADVFPPLAPVGVVLPDTGLFPVVAAAGPFAPPAFVGVVVTGAFGFCYGFVCIGGTCGTGAPLAGAAGVVLAGSGCAGVLFEAAVVGFP